MTGDNIQVVVAMAAYLIFMLIIGLWYAKKSNANTDEYFLGGRGLGAWVAAMSAEASDMSGWLLMGLPGVAYFTGAGEAAWTAIGLAMGTYINWRLVSVRLRKYSQIAGDSITLPDFFSNRFRDKKRILMTIASLIILLFFAIYVGSQFVTFGKLFGYVFGTEDYYKTMVVLGAIFVLLYTFIGGFLAESTTDFIQGILMFFSLIVVLIIGVIKAGGLSEVSKNLSEIPRFTDFFGIATPLDSTGEIVKSSLGNSQTLANGKGLFGAGSDYGFINIISCLAWGLGYFGMPQVLLRFMAIRKTSELRRARTIAVTWCVISLAVAVGIGLIGQAVLPGEFATAADSEKIFIVLAVKLLPPVFAGVVLSGILAASMSSSDSYMLIASSAVAKNIFGGLLYKKASDRSIMWIARATLLIVTVFGILIAIWGNDSIFEIVSYAWAGFGAAFGPLILFSLFWKRTNLPGAIAGMATGGVMVIVWKQFISKLGGVFGIYELLPAFILSCIVIVAVSLLTKAPSEEICEEYDSVRTADI